MPTYTIRDIFVALSATLVTCCVWLTIGIFGWPTVTAACLAIITVSCVTLGVWAGARTARDEVAYQLTGQAWTLPQARHDEPV